MNYVCDYCGKEVMPNGATSSPVRWMHKVTGVSTCERPLHTLAAVAQRTACGESLKRLNTTKGTPMFTTTLTKTVASTLEYRFAIGDIICWSYRMHEPVEEASYEVVARRIDANGEQRYDLRSLCGGKLYRCERALSDHTLARYVQPERGPLTETVETTEDVVVEHRWQVGDVIGDNYWKAEITSIGFATRDLIHEGWDQHISYGFNGQEPRGADTVEHFDDKKFNLVGGPRFIQPHKFTFPPPSRFKVGDKIQWPANVEHGGYYEVTAVHGNERYDIVSHDEDEGKRYTQRLPETVTLYVEPEAAQEPELTPLIVLREARNLISLPEKWTKGTWDDGGGAYCLSGALRKAAGAERGDGNPPPGASRKAWDEANDLVEAQIQAITGGTSIPAFNDPPSRTHEQVLAVLDKAIAEQVLATV